MRLEPVRAPYRWTLLWEMPAAAAMLHRLQWVAFGGWHVGNALALSIMSTALTTVGKLWMVAQQWGLPCVDDGRAVVRALDSRRDFLSDAHVVCGLGFDPRPRAPRKPARTKYDGSARGVRTEPQYGRGGNP